VRGNGGKPLGLLFKRLRVLRQIGQKNAVQGLESDGLVGAILVKGKRRQGGELGSIPPLPFYLSLANPEPLLHCNQS